MHVIPFVLHKIIEPLLSNQFIKFKKKITEANADRDIQALMIKKFRKILRQIDLSGDDKHEDITPKDTSRSIYSDIGVISQLITLWVLYGGETFFDKCIIVVASIIILIGTIGVSGFKFFGNDVNMVLRHHSELSKKSS